MKKYLLYALTLAAAATVMSSCKNEVDMIFDSSAAERLDEAKAEYLDVLTRDGGKWVMEYFASEDLPGFSFVMTFTAAGDVTIAGGNSYIGSDYVSKTSLWELITDDGVVLTFNSYNPLIHVFCDPDASKGLGYEGDYEFIILDVSDDGNTISLKGKKHQMPIMMRRLGADTNDEEFVAAFVYQNSAMFNASINRAILTYSPTGERFIMTNGASGIMSVYPEKGDSVTQTETGNIIITADGFRFMRPLSVSTAASAADSVSFQCFALQSDGTLLCTDEGLEGTTVTADPLSSLFVNKKFVWRVDLTSPTGTFATLFDNISAEFEKGSASLLNSDIMMYDETSGMFCVDFIVRARVGKVYRTTTTPYYFNVTTGENLCKLEYVGTNSDGESLAKSYPALMDYINYLNGSTLYLHAANILSPATVTVSTADGSTLVAAIQ